MFHTTAEVSEALGSFRALFDIMLPPPDLTYSAGYNVKAAMPGLTLLSNLPNTSASQSWSLKNKSLVAGPIQLSLFI